MYNPFNEVDDGLGLGGEADCGKRDPRSASLEIDMVFRTEEGAKYTGSAILRLVKRCLGGILGLSLHKDRDIKLQ